MQYCKRFLWRREVNGAKLSVGVMGKAAAVRIGT